MNKKNIILVVIISVILSIVMILNNSRKDDEIVLVNNSEKTQNDITIQHDDEDEKEDVKEKNVVVYISGEVVNPKVLTMQSGKRLVDAVENCGGFTEDADRDKVNLALLLKDESHYVIPKIGQDTEDNKYFESETQVKNGQGLVNINIADANLLKTLPGIGDKTAEKIIQYREKSGNFKSIEEIKNVDGIGDKKFEQIESLITV